MTTLVLHMSLLLLWVGVGHVASRICVATASQYESGAPDSDLWLKFKFEGGKYWSPSVSVSTQTTRESCLCHGVRPPMEARLFASGTLSVRLDTKGADQDFRPQFVFMKRSTSENLWTKCYFPSCGNWGKYCWMENGEEVEMHCADMTDWRDFNYYPCTN